MKEKMNKEWKYIVDVKISSAYNEIILGNMRFLSVFIYIHKYVWMRAYKGYLCVLDHVG